MNTILVVEDESIIAQVAKRNLESCDYAVITVNNGGKALDAIENNEIDLILMDIDLGNEIDGTQLAEIILSKIDIPILFLSSYTEQRVIEKTRSVVSYGYIVKSYNIRVLDTSIQVALKLFAIKKQQEAEERDLKKFNDQFRQIVQVANAGIVMINSDLTISYVNKKAADMMQYQQQELIGTNVASFLFNEDAKIKLDEEYLRIPRVTYDLPLIRKDGCTVWVNISSSRLCNLQGKFSGSVVVLTDISERMMLEDSLNHTHTTINALSGSIPVCAKCKDIRDENGLWIQIEEYFRDRIEAEFTHGLCPKCMPLLFPGYKTQNELLSKNEN